MLISGTRRGPTPKLLADLHRRSAIKPEIGHMKTHRRLARCPLKGPIKDAILAVLCRSGHNIRKILAHLTALWHLIQAAFGPPKRGPDQPQAAWKRCSG